MTGAEWFHPRGALARDRWDAVVDSSVPGWQHTGLRIASLGEPVNAKPGTEKIVVPLEGSITLIIDGPDGAQRHELERSSVFAGPSDVLYVASDASVRISGTGRVAITESTTDAVLPTRLLHAQDVPVELRGAGAASRQVHSIGMGDGLPAARLIVCEVVTPSGNWSSYPPHKHDTHIPGHESALEEIYYFEAAVAREEGAAQRPSASDPFGTFSAYSSEAGTISIDERVHTGDIALIPFGYHGPAAAAPGYELYYLNVMAGPEPGREWRVSEDPRHAWVRESWTRQHLDPRLPYTQES